MDKTIPFSLYSLRLLRVHVCNLNPTFPRSESRTGYIVDFAIVCIQRYYPKYRRTAVRLYLCGFKLQT